MLDEAKKQAMAAAMQAAAGSADMEKVRKVGAVVIGNLWFFMASARRAGVCGTLEPMDERNLRADGKAVGEVIAHNLRDLAVELMAEELAGTDKAAGV